VYLGASWSTPPKRGLSGVAISTNPNSVVVTVVWTVVAAAVISSKRWQWLLLIFKLMHSAVFYICTSLIRHHHLLHHSHLWRHQLHRTILSSCFVIFTPLFLLPNCHLELTFCHRVIPWSHGRVNLLSLNKDGMIKINKKIW